MPSARQWTARREATGIEQKNQSRPHDLHGGGSGFCERLDREGKSVRQASGRVIWNCVLQPGRGG